jgi:hypothetical protein
VSILTNIILYMVNILTNIKIKPVISLPIIPKSKKYNLFNQDDFVTETASKNEILMKIIN